jgi:hypothetical protein
LAGRGIGGYDTTVDIVVRPGSALLQASFYGLAVAIVAGAALLVRHAAIGVGDGQRAASRLQRRFLIGAGLWVAVVSTASYSGALLPRGGAPLPFVAMLVGVVTLGIGLARSPVGDRLARGLPLSYLVGFQAFRFPLELAMHRAYSEGLMPVQMSYAGRNFDIVTGITALVLGGVLLRVRLPSWVVLAWNLMGLGLLCNILGVAVLSTPMFAYFGPDRLNVWVMWMPYTLLPAVMVVAAWAGHLIVFRALYPSRSIQAGSSM